MHLCLFASRLGCWHHFVGSERWGHKSRSEANGNHDRHELLHWTVSPVTPLKCLKWRGTTLEGAVDLACDKVAGGRSAVHPATS